MNDDSTNPEDVGQESQEELEETNPEVVDEAEDGHAPNPEVINSTSDGGPKTTVDRAQEWGLYPKDNEKDAPKELDMDQQLRNAAEETWES